MEYESVDDLISRQCSRVEVLRQSIALFGDRAHLRDELRTATELVESIKCNMDELRRERDVARDLIEQCEESIAYMQAIDDRLEKALDLQEDDNEEEQVSLRNDDSDCQPPTRRCLDFEDNRATPDDKLVQYVTEAEYRTIPGYMLGRVPLETINAFIEKINTCLEEKYKILSMPRVQLKKKRIDIDKYNEYKRQECPQTTGKRFFTQDDLKVVLGGKIDKQSLNIITMLRHTRHLKENRDGGLLRYITNYM